MMTKDNKFVFKIDFIYLIKSNFENSNLNITYRNKLKLFIDMIRHLIINSMVILWIRLNDISHGNKQLLALFTSSPSSHFHRTLQHKQNNYSVF
jgi:hypothetical protein